MKRMLRLAAIASIALVAVLVVRARPTAPAMPTETRRTADPDAAGAAQRLAVAVTYPTVSRAVGDQNLEAIAGLSTFLAESYSAAHRVLERETVNEHSLLYRWPGLDPSLPPLLLLGHLDVVPVPAETEDAWSVPPFGGVVADGFIWGRGTLDDKVNVLGALEAVELLANAGFSPRRTVLLAFGHDEEIGGEAGAARIADLLEARGVAPWLVLDEGLAIIDDLIDGLDAPAALFGLGEKGYVSLELLARAEGGHSSMPPRHTAVGRLARALSRLEARPMKAGLDGPGGRLFDTLVPALPFRQRLVLANRWLFSPLIVRSLLRAPGTAATVRTTTAPTLLRAGIKDNVLPSEARAVVNFRIHPRDSVAAVEAHVREVIGDEGIEIERVGNPASEPSPLSPAEGAPWEVLTGALRAVYPEALVAPGLVLGGTDARHYARLSPHVYRFTPVRFGDGDLERVHGVDERVGVDVYARAIAYYAELIHRAAGPDAPR